MSMNMILFSNITPHMGCFLWLYSGTGKEARRTRKGSKGESDEKEGGMVKESCNHDRGSGKQKEKVNKKVETL